MIFIFLALFAVQLQAVLIPGPSGPNLVSYHVHGLTDNSREDPYAPPESPHKRRIVISSFLPVEKGQGCRTTQIPYMPPNTTAAYRLFAAQMGLPTTVLDDLQLEFCQSCNSTPKKYPLAIFSPGLTGSRLLYTAQARALSSLGFVVITVDHPYDALLVEFPDGTSVQGTIPYNSTEAESNEATKVRAADVSFVVDALQGSASGVRLPRELVKSIDLNKVFAYGHSIGGATALEAALLDDRILGGLNFDGRPWAETAKAGSDKPSIIVGSPPNSPLWPPFYEKFRGPKMQVSLEGTMHLAFMDIAFILGVRPLPEEYDSLVQQLFGTMAGSRLQQIVLAFVSAFSELVVNDETQPLRGLNVTFPEIVVGQEDLSA